ncbi:alpha-protein kinase vwkA [Ditylenchus destructor]|uniref:Alpha-protein kinase vwkA n=1 Tax=Ditylenchus destructor TaxID=166010 RepID=A0AAD4MP70_9BILA|nr:alpha-protein kinase vwkA [Ditylenchus destructor]
MGGMEKASNLSWSHKFGTKVIFHIADAPCHGKEFFNGLGFDVPDPDGSTSELNGYNDDRYPDGDPDGRTPEEFFEKVFPKKGIQYHFGKINTATDKMIKEFRKISESPIKEFDIKDVQAMTDKVVNMVSASIDHVVKKARTQYKQNNLDASNSGGYVLDSGTDVNADSNPDVSNSDSENNSPDIDNTEDASDSKE